MYAWPTPTPAGPLMKPLARLADLVAAAPTFYARCGLGAPDAGQLLAGVGGDKRIYLFTSDLDAISIFPSAVVRARELMFDQDSGGARNYCIASGTLALVLVDKGRYANDVERSGRDFANFAGNTFKEITDSFASDDNLAGYRMQSFWGPDYDVLATEDGPVDRWMCGVEVHW